MRQNELPKENGNIFKQNSIILDESWMLGNIQQLITPMIELLIPIYQRYLVRNVRVIGPLCIFQLVSHIINKLTIKHECVAISEYTIDHYWFIWPSRIFTTTTCE